MILWWIAGILGGVVLFAVAWIVLARVLWKAAPKMAGEAAKKAFEMRDAMKNEIDKQRRSDEGSQPRS